MRSPAACFGWTIGDKPITSPISAFGCSPSLPPHCNQHLSNNQLVDTSVGFIQFNFRGTDTHGILGFVCKYDMLDFSGDCDRENFLNPSNKGTTFTGQANSRPEFVNQGGHTSCVKAVDISGIIDPVGSCFSWNLD